MIIMGADRMTVRPMNTTVWTCCTSLVLRVMSDAGPKWLISTWEKRLHRLEDGGAQVAPEAHGHLGAPVDRGHRSGAHDQGHDQHQRPDREDVLGVAGGDALVDDVRVQVRQVQRGDGLDEQHHEHDDDLARGRARR